MEMPFESAIVADAFFLADFARVESGKLYVSGGFWTRMNFATFPAVLHFGVAAVLRVPWAAYHEGHKFTIWFEDADGQRISGELSGEFKVGAGADMKWGDDTVLPFAAMVNNFRIAAAGDYAAVLAVDGTEIDRWRFRAVQQATAAQPGAAPAGGAPRPPAPPSPSDIPKF
jgi:hypothetical protein